MSTTASTLKMHAIGLLAPRANATNGVFYARSLSTRLTTLCSYAPVIQMCLHRLIFDSAILIRV